MKRLRTTDGTQIEDVIVPKPERAVTMIAQLIAGVRMDEHIERAVIECEPTDNRREFRGNESNLVAPHRMRPNRAFVKATQFDPLAELPGDDLA